MGNGRLILLADRPRIPAWRQPRRSCAAGNIELTGKPFALDYI
jgi:hypothetical protein